MLCGIEFVTKDILQSVFAMLGLPVQLGSPLITLLYTVLCIAVSYKVLTPVLHKYFGRLLGTEGRTPHEAANAYVKQMEKQDRAAM